MPVPGIVPTVVCNRRGSPHLCGLDVPADLRALVVERTVCPHDNPECSCKPVVSVVGGVDGDGVERALSDFGGCVEVRQGEILFGDHLLPTLEKHGLYMALSTSTAYSLAPARLFCNVLQRRHGLSGELRDAIELSVHEAVANGLLHGNLEIGSADRQSLEGLRRFGQAVSAHLDEPSLANRRIEVSAVVTDEAVEVAVIDSGPGYDPDALAGDDGLERKSGRGLELIRHFARSVEIAEGGRRLTMRFAR